MSEPVNVASEQSERSKAERSKAECSKAERCGASERSERCERMNVAGEWPVKNAIVSD